MGTMTLPRRNGNKWNVNEILDLQREYELLEMDIQEIAKKHERSVYAILHKLHNENFIGENEIPRGFAEYENQNINSCIFE